jgi:hypothetical protein
MGIFSEKHRRVNVLLRFDEVRWPTPAKRVGRRFAALLGYIHRQDNR